jgi:Serine phosphatase RsbU, regulator of sigma subunit
VLTSERQNLPAEAVPQELTRARVLVGDDQHDILTALSLLLKLNGFVAETADSPERLLAAANAGQFDLILMDLNYTRDTTSGDEGLQLLSRLHTTGCLAPVIVMTAWGNIDLAVEAMRLGAADFVQKPWDNDRLLATVRKQLERAEAAQRQRHLARSEWEIARHVQQKLLPQKLRVLRTLDYAAACLPARDVGGDYYDFFDLDEHRIAGVLGDVSGKGIAAAILMANLQASFRTQLDSGAHEPVVLLETVNRLFYASTPLEQYVTLFYFEYDDRDRSLRYINCGHLPPVLLRSSGEITRLESTGTVLGLFPHCTLESRCFTLGENDLLIAFTDGVTDFLDDSGEEFGEDRFLPLAATVRRLHSQAATRRLTDCLRALSSGRDQFDDQTLIVLRGQ